MLTQEMTATVEQLKKIQRQVDIKNDPMALDVIKQWIYFQEHPILKFKQLQFKGEKWTMYTLSVDGTLEQPHVIEENLIKLYLKGEISNVQRSTDFRLDSFMCNLLGKINISTFQEYATTKPFYRLVYQFYNNEIICKMNPSDPDMIEMMTSDPIAINPHPEMIIGKNAQQLIDDRILQPNWDKFPE